MQDLFATRWASFMLTLALLCSAATVAAQSSPDNATDNDFTVQVKKNGEVIVVDVGFSVAATPQEAWAVLTDFDRMASFVSNLASSKVLSRNGNVLQIEQKGKAARGVFSFDFESVREITLTPPRAIHTHLISGNMKKFDGVTLISPENGGTRVTYHGESVPTVWVPPVVGTGFIASEVREQFQEMRAEILRRKNGAATK